MTEAKRCVGNSGVWVCVEEYPDHMVPIDKFSTYTLSKDGLQPVCKLCRRLYDDKYNPHRESIRRKAREIAGINDKELRAMSTEDRKTLYSVARTTLKNSPIKNSKPELPKIQKDPKTKSISVPRETYPREGYVYIFQDMMKPKGVYKIGSTDDVGGRLSNARTWGEFQCVRWFYSDDCKALEKRAHNELSEFKIKKDGMGDEWFQIAKAAAINKIQELSNASTAV